MGILGAGINFSIGKVGSAAPVEAWVDMTSNTYWAAFTGNNWGSWNAGGWWDAGQQGKGPSNYVYLNPLFNVRLWRPTKVRLTYTPARADMSFYGTDANGGPADRLWSDSTYTSGTELDITWDGDAEIDDMNVDADGVYDGATLLPLGISNQGEGDFDVTKIEFYGFLPS